MVSVYLLPLRHPVLVARQLSTISTFAPGRLILGVGIGGEDRHEVEICGVDPATRGRRMDEALAALRLLFDGRAHDFNGEFFEFERALVLPPPRPQIPILIGGRSDAALRRTAEFGDGWLATWVSPRRFGEAVEEIERAAGDFGRPEPSWRHTIQVWCGFDDDAAEARSHVARAMESLYRIPFEKFERWSPYGTPEEVAEALAQYLEAGCTTFNLLPQARSDEVAIAGAARVKELLVEWADVP